MHCPSCGLEIPTGHAATCPACGRALAQPATSSAASGASPAPTQQSLAAMASPVHAESTAASSSFEAAPASAPSAAQAAATSPAPQPYVLPPGPTGYSWPAYGQSAPALYPPAYPPPYPPAIPPGYSPAVPSGYHPGYPWAAPVTTPMAAWPTAPAWYPPSSPAAPALPERKRRTGLLVGSIIAAVLIVCVSGVGLLYALASHLPTPRAAISTSITLTPLTPTSPTHIVYQNSLTTATDGWPNDTRCFFRADGYHITNGTICFAPAGDETDIDVSVHVRQVSGPITHTYGVVFRATPSAGTAYYFSIDSNSKWIFYRCVAHNCTTLVRFTPNSAIQAGLNTPNTLEVRARGGHFEFFVNGTQIGQADDSSIQSGYVGLVAGSSIECVFDNLTVSRLS